MPLHAKLSQPISALWYSATGSILAAFIVVVLGSFFSFSGFSACTGDGCTLIAPSTVVPFLIIVAILVLAYPVLHYFFFSFELTEHTVTVNSGILFRKYETVAFDRIQAVEQDRGPLLMLFGLTEVNIWTASADQLSFSVEKAGQEAHPHPDARILLRSGDAQKLNETISRFKTGSAGV